MFGDQGKQCGKGILWVTLVSEYLRSPRGLGPGQPLVVAFVGGGGENSPEESPSLLGPLGLPGWGGLPFLVSPGWRGSIFIFLLLIFMGGVRRGVIGR